VALTVTVSDMRPIALRVMLDNIFWLVIKSKLILRRITKRPCIQEESMSDTIGYSSQSIIPTTTRPALYRTYISLCILLLEQSHCF
jgi:hypothetical protein